MTVEKCLEKARDTLKDYKYDDAVKICLDVRTSIYFNVTFSTFRL